MQHQTDTRFPDAAAADYDRRILTLVPGYQFAQSLLTATLAQALPPQARLLLAGCGTGNELIALAGIGPQWLFSTVEPSAGMLAAARTKAEMAGCEPRVTFHQQLLDQVPQALHDAAVCSLVLHFIADDGAKLAFLQQLAARLSPGAPLLLFDYQPDGLPVSHYQHWLQSAGHSLDGAREVIERTRSNWHPLAAQRARLLLTESGFTSPQLLCDALGFRLSLLYRRA